ncbi:MAG: ABC transporter ATP-binding protein [Salinibacter sp.]
MISVARKFLALLNNHERKRLYLLFAAVLATAFAEVGGIASIMPFLSLVADPESVHNSQILTWFYDTFGFRSENRFLFVTGIGVLLVLTASNTLKALMIWGLMRFSWMRYHALSHRLMGRYLQRPYVFFLNRNTADLGKNILQEVGQLTNGIMIPGLRALARGIVALTILGFLVAIDPLLALIVALVLGGAYGILYLGVRTWLHRLGRDRFRANEERFRIANEAFGGIKQLKLLGREPLMLDRYSSPSKRFCHAQATNAVINQIPRFGMELLAFGGLLVIVLYLLAAGLDLSQVLPLAGVYAFAGYRLMPSLQQVFQGAAKARFNATVLDSIHEELEGVSDNPFSSRPGVPPVPLPFHDSLDLRGIKYHYPGAARPALADVDLTIQAQSSVAFVGKTGAGKTTLADVILGLLVPDAGEMSVDGTAITEDNRIRWQRNLGYIPQEIFLHDSSVASNIAFAVPPDEIDQTAVEEAARLANIHDFITQELPHGYATEIGERGVRLSGGQRQRIGIARALYHDPAVLVMDEATSALDSVTEQAVFEAIRNVAATRTLVIIAHRLTTIRDCDIIYLLDGGQIVASGNYEELVERQPRFQEMADVQA